MNPEDDVKRKKESGEKMSKIEKVLYLRCTEGLGLLEARDRLIETDNYFDGPWKETRQFKCSDCGLKYPESFCATLDTTLCRWCSGEEDDE